VENKDYAGLIELGGTWNLMRAK